VGHSERRQYFQETDLLIGEKLQAALRGGLEPVLCVGESLDHRESGKTDTVIRGQLQGALARLTPLEASRIIMAYEPVWAIGTGRTATPEMAQQVHRLIRDYLSQYCGVENGERTRILYGGSVKPDNVDGLMSQPDIDGALVGGASLKAEDFARIVNYRA
jgi:triosephosphate isomerase